MPVAPRSILVSAGEASGDFYAALLVAELRRRWPHTQFFGCAGSNLREAGIRNVIDAESLAVVGLVEVVGHLPRIYRQYRKLLAAIRAERPDLAILTDSPDFHLRIARKLKNWGIPVVYFVAPQVWAWRKGRLPVMRRVITRLLCIFPFEERFFRANQVDATFIGHPLSNRVRPSLTKAEFFRKHDLPEHRPLIAVLPGSRRGEAARHLPELCAAAALLGESASFVLPASATTGAQFFRDRMGSSAIHVIQGEAWDALAHADIALAASGTVTVEAALLGTPMIAFYKVNKLSWILGKLLVRIPFYSMVNLIAEREVIPELMQHLMTGPNLADAARGLLHDAARRAKMKKDLREVAGKLWAHGDAIQSAADEVMKVAEQAALREAQVV